MDCPLFFYSIITASIKSTAPALQKKKQDKDGKVKCLSNYALTVKLINKISIIISVYILNIQSRK